MRHIAIARLTPEQVERFNAKVDRSSDCHVWTGSQDVQGRGRFSLNRYPTLAPRIAYRIANDSDPGDAVVMHTCDNPSCVNPAHLRLGTQAENLADCCAKGRSSRGERNGHNRRAGKLTEALVRSIKARLRAGERGSAIAREVGVGHAQISNIKHGYKWSWVQ